MTIKMINQGLLIALLAIAFACAKSPVINESEKKWLKNHPDLSIGISPNQPPYEFINEKGQLDGMFINFLTIIEDRLDYEFKKIFQPDWIRLLSDAKDGKVDIVLEIQETNERKEFLNFTPFLLSHKHVIVVKKTREDITSISNLKDKKIAVVNTYAVQEYLFKNYPGYSVIPFFDNVTGLRAVSTGQADAFIGQQAVATYYLETEGISNLKIAGEIDYPNELAIASRKDLDTLNIILSKAVNSITKTDKQTIYNRWLSYEVKPFYADIKFWIVPLIVILVSLGFVILFNLALRKKVKQKTNELKVAKEKAEENYALLRIAGEKAKLGGWNVDLKEFRAYWSDVVAAIHEMPPGYSPLVEDGINYYAPIWREKITKVFTECAQYGIPYDEEMEIITSTGKRVWVRTIGEAVRNEEGEIFKVEGAFQDITQRKQAENKVIESQAELKKALEISNQSRQTLLRVLEDQREAEKEIHKLNSVLEQRVIERTALIEASNKELEAFSYSVSHDLRAPLRHINGFVDLLSNQFKDELPDKAHHYLDTISGASRQMGTLIDELLQYSRTGRQEVRKTQLDMNLLVKEVTYQLMTGLEEREINWDIQQLPKVSGDIVLLKQVWANLLDNAVKYTRNQQTAKISVSCREETKSFVFCVSDNGVGFDMKYAHKLFGVFQRLHSQAEFEGTGIGLANVQRIVHKHLGRVWAEAEPGKGAKFYFSLPKYQEKKS